VRGRLSVSHPRTRAENRLTDGAPISPDLLKHYESLSESFSSASELREASLFLTHYTSIAVMEKIFRTNEIWFSNPLFMNDLQEMRFGLTEGARLFSDPELLKRAGTTEGRSAILQYSFSFYFDRSTNDKAIDTYVFCLSEHYKEDNDGLLSMWRGYGEHGSGVALVFNPANLNDVPESPLIVSKVSYGSDFSRRHGLKRILDRWADITANLNLKDNHLYAAAYMAFYVVKYFAITSKHIGFMEEREWRIIYDQEQDKNSLLSHLLGYHIGNRGVEPKLKYKIEPIIGVSTADTLLERLLERIILGPSISSPLAVKSVERMLEKIDRPEFKSLIRASGIPLRPLGGNSF
jgi:Protein of unknown function (DUF2971)